MFRIAFRNIFRQKRRMILTVLTMLGGFSLASLSIAWSDGTYNFVIDVFTRGRLGHIQVHQQGYLDRPSLYKTIDNSEEVGQIVGDVEGVVSWAPRLYSSGLVSAGENSAGARIMGIDPILEQATTRFESKITEGTMFSSKPLHQAILGQGLAKKIEAGLGDEVVVVSQGADGSIANDLYSVIGIAASGDKTLDLVSMYLNIQDAQELLVLPDRVHEIAITVSQLKIVEEVASDMAAALADRELAVDSWQEFARSFYHAMKADQQGSWIMLAVVMILVAVGVLNTVLMMVLERTREYGLLRAVGTSPGQVFRLVVYEVLVMAAISLFLGCGLSFAVNYGLSIEGIGIGQTLTYGGVNFDRMFTEVNARSFYVPALCVILSAILVSLLPALRAARVAPVKAMRTH